MKEWIKKRLKQSGIGRRIYPFCHKCYRLYSVPRRQRLMRRYGFTILDKVHYALTGMEIPYFVDYGTLLGVVREKGFIPHDFDIDVALPPTPHTLYDVYQALEPEGFAFNRAFEYDNKVVCMNVLYKGVPVDFFKYFSGQELGSMHCYSFYWDERQSYVNANENSARLATLPVVNDCPTLQVQGITTRIPVNFEQVLQCEYGRGWETPDKNWVEENQPNLVVCHNKGASVDLERVRVLCSKEKQEGRE